MAMIKCFECGREISDSAERCPHCGCVTSRGQTRSEAKGVLISFGVNAIETIVGIYLLFTGIGSFSIFKMLIGICLLIGGFVGFIINSVKARKFANTDDETSRNVKIIKADGSVVDELQTNLTTDHQGMKIVNSDGSLIYDNGAKWKCRCGRKNPSSLKRCYYCGADRDKK